MTEWYYADRRQQQQGPVTAETLVELLRGGQVDDTTLVWRDGLPDWQPLAGLRAELPLSAEVEPLATSGTADGDAWSAAPASTAPAEYTPYAAPAVTADAGSGPVLGGEIVYAGFWKRVAAYTIDSLLVGMVGGIIGTIIGAVMGAIVLAGDSSGVGLVLVQLVTQLISIAISAAYYAGFHASTGMATLGKMAVGIKVVRTDGTRISLARGIGRYFATLLSGLIIGIGFLMAAFTERKQGLHDIICDTLVVDKWAFTEHPEWQRRDLGAVTIVILVLLGLMIAVAGIGMLAVFGALFAANF